MIDPDGHDTSLDPPGYPASDGFQRLRNDLLADMLERKNREIADLTAANEFLKLQLRIMELRIERLLKGL